MQLGSWQQISPLSLNHKQDEQSLCVKVVSLMMAPQAGPGLLSEGRPCPANPCKKSHLGVDGTLMLLSGRLKTYLLSVTNQKQPARPLLTGIKVHHACRKGQGGKHW